MAGFEPGGVHNANAEGRRRVTMVGPQGARASRQQKLLVAPSAPQGARSWGALAAHAGRGQYTRGFDSRSWPRGGIPLEPLARTAYPDQDHDWGGEGGRAPVTTYASPASQKFNASRKACDMPCGKGRVRIQNLGIPNPALQMRSPASHARSRMLERGQAGAAGASPVQAARVTPL